MRKLLIPIVAVAAVLGASGIIANASATSIPCEVEDTAVSGIVRCKPTTTTTKPTTTVKPTTTTTEATTTTTEATTTTTTTTTVPATTTTVPAPAPPAAVVVEQDAPVIVVEQVPAEVSFTG